MSSEIDSTIQKWFEETVSKIDTEIKTDTPVDNLCSSVIPVAHNYCTAVLLLANNNRRLPAMALLRVLAELAFRCIWCLYRDNPANEKPEVRITRWLKRSYIERKSLLERIIGSDTVPDKDKQVFRKEVEELSEMIEGIPHRSAGKLLSFFDELPAAYKSDLYPLLYSTFNRAVHPDILLLGDLVREEGDRRVFLHDLDHVDPRSLKIYCMTAAFNILSVFRVNYDWDYAGMKSEYLALKKQFKQG